MKHAAPGQQPLDASRVAARVALVRVAARIGAISAESLARHERVSATSARARLRAAQRAGLLESSRPLADAPALFTATRAGLRFAGLAGFEPARISAANARHALVCAEVAAALERCFPRYVASGERELRRDERCYGAPLASANLDGQLVGASGLHRPDLVLWPRQPGELPVAIEVELTVKAPRRLVAICQAWARCRRVSGVLYLAAPEASAAVARAIDRSHAAAQIALLPLERLLGGIEGRERA